MAKDYGSRRSPARRGNSAPHQLLVITVTFLLGYLTASIWDVDTVGRWVNKQIAQEHGLQQQPEKPKPKQEAVLPKPKFEFYTLLANEKGGRSAAANQHFKTAPAASTAAASSANAARSLAVQPHLAKPASEVPKVAEAKPVLTKPLSKGNYVVQVASFKARNDAEHMKGLLTLKGFEVTVVPISTPAQGAWFRVIIGPYPNRILAQKAQVILAKTQRINGMVRSA